MHLQKNQPEPPTIAGVKLLRLQLGHLVNLEKIDSSFLSNRKFHGLGDLLLSILICSMPPDEFAEYPNLALKMRTWGRELRGGRMGAFWRQCKRAFGIRVTVEEVLGFNHHQACADFENYLLEQGAAGFILRSRE